MGDPCWSSLFLKDCAPWKGPILEQFVKNFSLWEGPTLEKFVEGCFPWEGPHAGAEEECEEEGAAETTGLGRLTEVTESQNRIGWKRPLRSSSPTVNLTLPRPPLYHVPKHLIQTSFKYLQGWRLNHFPGQSVPMLDNPFSEEKFPNIQSKPPLAQLEAISSCPITCYLGEETDPHLSTTSFQLLCPSLDWLQHLNVSLVVRGPKLNTVFEGHDHFPTPAGHTIFDTSQDAIGFLGHLGTLLAHIQAAVKQHPQVLLCQAAFQPLFPKPVALHGVAVAQVQDLALGLVEPHTIDLGPSIQPVQSLPPLKQINTPTQLGVICKLTEGALDPFIQIIDKDTKQDWPQHRALANTACDRPPTGVNSIHHHSLGPVIQPVLYPVKSPPVQAMSSQFLQENAVGNEPMPASSKTDLPLAKAEPISDGGISLWDNIFKKGKKKLHNSSWERGLRICERNKSADTKVSEEGGGGVVLGMGTEIPLQPMVKTVVRQVVPLQAPC
ncbi:hypothetical protein QYF61_000856 [Mycteria americana]|uniref:Uncharacterized protein n=1 Tax=Mycteria americana TaxID=33587 RepID=A0AAN7S1J2_MYCAM|nr:hypothetical protein QYF61_000856 [Mycteria americana]